MKRICFVIFCFATYSSYSQLIVNSGVSAADLIAGFIGKGIKVSNINLTTRAPNAYGTFQNGNTTNLGLNTGIVLTNGTATSISGPNLTGSMGACNGFSDIDPQLTAINSQLTEDLTVLEFDFVASGTNIDLSFVFGSEEYPEFVNASYNDWFGIFLSGPGPACQAGYYNNTNIATLPDNVTPVSIDNVNLGKNAAYYVNNIGGATIQYDGFTKRITRTVNLCPCQTYHIKIAIADAGDCYYDSGIFIEKLETVNAVDITSGTVITNVSCNGGSNGSIVPVITGGVGAYSYTWSNGASSASALGLSAGTYTLTVHDAYACGVSKTFTIAQPPAITATTSQTDVLCHGNATGTAIVNPAGGAGGYTYSWSPSGGTGASATGLVAGGYSVRIEDANGCFINKSFTIQEPSALTASTSQTNITCDNGANGSVKVNATGGTGPYSYTWAPAVTTGDEATGLTAGLYSIVVKDAKNCPATTQATVIVGAPSPATPQVSVAAQPSCTLPTGTVDVVSPLANGNTYSLNGGAWQSVASFTGLAQGSYTVSVKNADGCTTTGNTVTIQAQPVTPGVPQVTVTQPTCTVATGSIQMNDAGLSYSINNGAFQSSNNFPALSPGSYEVAVKNGQGCTNKTPVTILPQPATPAVPVVSTNGSTSFCEGSSVQLISSASGGNQWYADGAPMNGATGTTHEARASGSYRVVVTNTDGCNASSAPISVTVHPLPAKPVITTNGNPEFCEGGSVILEAPAAPAYLWSNQSTGKTITVNTAGLFSVQVKDANNCLSPVSEVLRVTVNPNPVFTITSEKGNSISRGTSTRLSTGISSGTIVWTPVTGLDFPNSFNPVAQPLANTKYQATITSPAGCATTQEISIIVANDYKITPQKVITPNGDGINDRFVIGNITAYPDNMLQVFDRAGKKVYEKRGYNNEWDGMIRDRPFVNDTYFYIIYIEGKVIKKGTVTIVK
ncbi:MAG: choice-of-anchor L domain-containing protein [Chitinophagaceae bacterium]|nr:choice-of-anchor L domain-containing protein [Chitinophagaceae bacterium]